MKFSTQCFCVGLISITLVFGLPKQDSIENPPKVRGIIDGMINSTINNILANISNPICIDNLPLNFTEEFLTGIANISGFQLYGIKDLVASQIDVSILSMAMNATIEIPQLIINSKYYADVTLAKLIPLYGSGRIGVTLDKIKLLVSGKVGITNGLSIKNVTVSFSLEDAVFDLHGLLNNEDLSALVNEILNDNFVSFVDDNQEVISEIISPIADQLINDILGEKQNSTELLELEEAIYLASLE